MRRRMSIVIVLLALVSLTAACGSPQPPESTQQGDSRPGSASPARPARGGQLVVAVRQEPPNPDFPLTLDLRR